MSQTVIGVSLPVELVQKIDEDRGDIPRSKFVSKLLEKAFKQGEQP